MPTEIRRDEVCQMVAGGAALVEVLPAEEYEAEHLPGAIQFFREAELHLLGMRDL